MPAGGLVTAAVVTGVATLGSSLFGSHATKSAAKTQSRSADLALAEQKRIFDIREKQNAPYLAASQDALKQMQSLASMQQYRQLPPAYGPGYRPQAYGMNPMPGGPQGPMPGPQAAEPSVLMRAPNGQVAKVPQSQVEMALKKGAVRS